MNTDTAYIMRTDMLAKVLANRLAEATGINPVHATNRVQIAVEIAERMLRAATPREANEALNGATRLDGKPVSHETKMLAMEFYLNR